MDITKDKLKRSAIVAAMSGSFAEYLSASVVNDFSLIKNYKFNQFYDAVGYNLSHPITSFSNALSNEAFTHIQPFIIGGMLLLAGKVLFQKTDKYEDASEYGSYGTSRWAKDSEIFNSSNISTTFKKEGTILGVHKRKPIIQHNDSYLNRNICLVGGSGAGKTRSIIIPNILHNNDKSIVVIDPKGELYEKTSQVKREQGYDVHLINFKNRDVSDRYNLFEYLRRDADSFKIADTLVSNAGEGSKVSKDFWNQKQISVLQTLILYVKYALPKEQQHMGSVQALSGLPEEELKNLFKEFPADHIVRIAFSSALEQLKEKTLADVFATMTNTLNPWLYKDVCEFTAANDFLFEDLGKKKMIVYVIMPIADNEFRPLITSFFSQMFSELYRLADNHFGSLPRKVLLMLDEFANIGKIPNFQERLSTTRSLGIEVTIVLQDTSQLENVYGKELAKEIINNCDIRLLLKANEPETAKYFSQLAGKTTIRVTNKSRSNSSKSSSKSESTNHIGRDLITADEITRMQKDEELLFLSGQYPMKIQKAWFDKFKNFKTMLNKDVSRDDYPVPDRGTYKRFFLESTFEETELFIPIEEPEIIEESEEILKELAQPEPEPEETESPDNKKEDSIDDLMNSFKF